jgi:hypothetical protein
MFWRTIIPSDPKDPNYDGLKVGIPCASAVGPRDRARPPGTDFSDAETGRQKSALKYVSARRDQSPASERPEIPTETPYSALPVEEPSTASEAGMELLTFV